VDLTNKLKNKIIEVVNNECELIKESERSRLFLTLDFAVSNDQNIIQSTLLNLIVKDINSKSQRSLGELNELASDYLLSKYSVLLTNALNEAMSEQPDIDLTTTLTKFPQEGNKNTDKWTLPFVRNFSSTKIKSNPKKSKRSSDSSKPRQRRNNNNSKERSALTARSIKEDSMSITSSEDPPAPKEIPAPPPLETSEDHSTPSRKEIHSSHGDSGFESSEEFSPPPPKEIPSPPQLDHMVFTLPLPSPHPRVTRNYFTNSPKESKRKSSQTSSEHNSNTKN